MTPAALLRWDSLGRRRRLSSRLVFVRLLAHPAVLPLLAGAALAFAPFEVWRLVALVGPAIVVMGGPWRMFWRRDSALLARLPIPGLALYRLAAYTAARLSLQIFAALALGAIPLVARTHSAAPLLFAALLCLTAAAAAPIPTALAGAVIISARTQELIKQATSGQILPGIVFLSLFPAAGGLGIAYAGWNGSLPLLAAVLALSVMAHEAIARLTAPTLSDATREIAALDAVKLAHVDRTSARGIEKLVGHLSGPPPGRAIYEKDVALLRRRHPGFYILTGIAILIVWIITAASAPSALEIALGTAGALGAYVVLTGRRLAVPPTEQPRLLTTLPIPPASVSRAKIVHVVFRAVWAIGLATTPILVRTAALTPIPILIAGAILFLTSTAAILAARPLD